MAIYCGVSPFQQDSQGLPEVAGLVAPTKFISALKGFAFHLGALRVRAEVARIS
jgi:hypothetical protein